MLCVTLSYFFQVYNSQQRPILASPVCLTRGVTVTAITVMCILDRLAFNLADDANAAGGLSALAALGFKLGEIVRPDRLMLTAQFQQIGPGEEAGVVAVAEHDFHGIAAHRIEPGD